MLSHRSTFCLLLHYLFSTHPRTGKCWQISDFKTHAPFDTVNFNAILVRILEQQHTSKRFHVINQGLIQENRETLLRQITCITCRPTEGPKFSWLLPVMLSKTEVKLYYVSMQSKPIEPVCFAYVCRSREDLKSRWHVKQRGPSTRKVTFGVHEPMTHLFGFTQSCVWMQLI